MFVFLLFGLNFCHLHCFSKIAPLVIAMPQHMMTQNHGQIFQRLTIDAIRRGKYVYIYIFRENYYTR